MSPPAATSATPKEMSSSTGSFRFAPPPPMSPSAVTSATPKKNFSSGCFDFAPPPPMAPSAATSTTPKDSLSSSLTFDFAPKSAGHFNFPVKATRHSKYYLDFVVLLVDSTLYKIPSRYLLEHKPKAPLLSESKLFAGLNRGEGSSDDNPLRLWPLPYLLKADKFEYLVRVILALSLGFPTPKDYSFEQWFHVLKLSRAWELSEIATLAMKHIKDLPLPLVKLPQWSSALDFCCNNPLFADLRSLAIARIEELYIPTPIDKITLGRKHHIKHWMLEGLRGLATEPSLPPQQDLRVLDQDTLMRFLYLRDEVLKSTSKLVKGPVTALEVSDVKETDRVDIGRLVEKHFKEEFSKMELVNKIAGGISTGVSLKR
ncbi:hypothetical protein E1B28_010265 [Marasmius oreades]|uniref:Uncharacterized protein n=1 Tax=Marasmius oreades TaxID=181124 RepID=A0A9P7RWV0_9AGAR|nr:uncharacterized protein E1B28_010265 [Marasmius oreades]KAG7091214.1 hypothetical protein E1B28_010265 [Marasmius oreades]